MGLRINSSAPIGAYHIRSIEHLNELPSQIVVRLAHLKNVIHYQVEAHRPGDMVSTSMFGETITMPYDVARHLAILHKLEN